MILGKLTRYLRTLESKLASPLSQQNTVDSNETSVVISLQIVPFINSN